MEPDFEDVQKIGELEKKLKSLEKINRALVKRVERSVDSSGDSYSLFESNILLQSIVDERTKELAETNEQLRQEIAERKRAELALRESERRLKVKLDYILSTEGVVGNIDIRDILEIEDLQRIQDAFADATGVASIITDPDGNPITAASNFCGVCEMVRKTEKGGAQCIRSDKILGEKARMLLKPSFEECHSCGFIDAAAPIIVDGKHIATWLIGQSNVGGVDNERISRYADEIGADAGKMLEAYSRMSSMSLERFSLILELLWILAKELSTLAFHNLELTKDIARRKQSEDELLKAKRETEAVNLQLQQSIDHANRMAVEAKAASVAKSEFLANMSHEIRTPLNGIIGMTELVMNTELDDEQRDYIEIVKSSSENLLKIINDILDFSKIEAGQMELEYIEFSLRELVDSSIETLAFKAQEKGLEMITYIAPLVPDTLLGDPTRLRQIILNLVGNAIKFTEDGEIILSVELEGESETNPVLHFSISDTGIGIPEDRKNAILEGFTQVDGSTTRKYGGTGLGTTISRQLVNLMGGDIWAESPTNKDKPVGGPGSTFHFTAKFGYPKCKANIYKIPDKTDYAGVRILIVDDNESSRIYLNEIIQNWGFSSSTATDGNKALESLQNARSEGTPYRLIIVDSKMPGMDGFELVEEIKRRPEFNDLSIIMLASVFQKGETARCRELGITKFLSKPVKHSALFNAIINETYKEPPDITRKSTSAQKPFSRSAQGYNILLVEDNPVNQKLAVRLLEKRGYLVSVANDGGEALNKAERERFDIILMDVQMPNMDGIAATRALRSREIRSGGHIPIIAMTAHAFKSDKEKCLDAGMDDYISKPINAEELCTIIDKHVSPNTAG